MTDKPVRIIVNGEVHGVVEMTRQIAESYLPGPQCPDPDCKFGKRSLPADWDPDVLSIAHLVSAQRRARIAGLAFDIGKAVYRMRPEAAMQVEAALMATAAGGMSFRNVAVVIDESVPWVDFEVVT